MLEVTEHTGDAGGLAVRWRAAPAAAPILYLHGVPTGSADWLPYLERIGGVAPDLPGFGRSEKPAGFDYSIAGMDRWLEAFTGTLGLERFSLVVHDWGLVGLAFAQRFPERIERLVIHNCAPLLPGYRWHWIARLWRTPGVGELFMATSTRWGFKQISRQANAAKGPLPDWFLDRFWTDFDRGTRRAILRLYRASPPEVLAGAGERLGELKCPALVLWGTRDPYIGAGWGPRYAQALGGDVRLEMIEDAGHWLWLDRPDVIDIVADFVRPAR